MGIDLRIDIRYTFAGDIAIITDYKKGAIMGLPGNIFDYEYTYDKLHRLKTEQFKDSAEAVIPAPFPPASYTYDPIGNITSKTAGTVTLGYTYHPTKKHAVNSITVNGTPYNFVYDNNGNMISGYDLTNPAAIVARSMTWNSDNMPTVVTRNSISTTLAYDGEGTRVKKTGPSGTTYYIGDHFEVSNSDPTKYIFAGNLRIAKVGAASGTYYFHKDHLGSSSAMTTVLGSVQEESNYMPFGEQREHTGLTLTNYKFTDQELDPETGLYNYGARLYDAVTGRFVSADTIVPDYTNPQSLNRYSYTLNNPLIYVDPSGHVEYSFDIDTNLSYNSAYYDPGYFGSSTTLSSGYSLGTSQLAWQNWSNAIVAVPGYPETGQNAWRKANDAVFSHSVNAYNEKYNLTQGTPGYWTSERLKAQAMIESGGSKNAFLTDPLQVNNHGDWDPAKTKIAGLSEGQAMTPSTSSAGALEWMRYKGYIHDANGNEVEYRGDYQALRRYNGNTNVYGFHLGMEHRDWYARQILYLEFIMREGR